MKKGSKPSAAKPSETVAVDQLSQRYQNAYQWYFKLRSNNDRTDFEAGLLLEIEEAQKTEILKQYNYAQVVLLGGSGQLQIKP